MLLYVVVPVLVVVEDNKSCRLYPFCIAFELLIDSLDFASFGGAHGSLSIGELLGSTPQNKAYTLPKYGPTMVTLWQTTWLADKAGFTRLKGL